MTTIHAVQHSPRGNGLARERNCMVSSLWCDRFSVSFVGIVVPALPVPVHASAVKTKRTKNQKKKHTNTHTKSWMAVPVRRDGLGIAVRHAVRLAAKTSREGAQFRRRGAVRPLQPACHEEENAILFHRPRRDHLHTKHRDTTVKWCKSCPSRRALDDGLSSNSSIFFSISPSFPFSIVVSNGVSRVQNVEKNYSFRTAHRAEKVLVNISEKFYVSWDIQLLLHVTIYYWFLSYLLSPENFRKCLKWIVFFLTLCIRIAVTDTDSVVPVHCKFVDFTRGSRWGAIVRTRSCASFTVIQSWRE